jgi:hypothetical protein
MWRIGYELGKLFVHVVFFAFNLFHSVVKYVYEEEYEAVIFFDRLVLIKGISQFDGLCADLLLLDSPVSREEGEDWDVWAPSTRLISGRD